MSDISVGKWTGARAPYLYDGIVRKHNVLSGRRSVNRPTGENLQGSKGSNMLLDEIHRKREAIARLG